MDELKPLPQLTSLEGKRALITGSALCIGRSIAYRFAEAGADLDLVDISLKGLHSTEKELSQFNSEVNVHKVDVSRQDEITSLWKKLEGREPDILVNNTAVYPYWNYYEQEIDESLLDTVMDINLKSATWMCHHMIGSRMKRGGVIINIGSIEAIISLENDLVPYTFSKAGVVTLTRNLASEYGSAGFRINAVIPGGRLNPGTQADAQELDRFSKLARFKESLLKSRTQFKMRLPLNRGGQPDEIARVALFLASDLSSYVHGALVVVDGGFLSA